VYGIIFSKRRSFYNVRKVKWVIHFWVLEHKQGKKTTMYTTIVWVATAAADDWLNAECAKTEEEYYYALICSICIQHI
jgi:hypothetical protein